MRIFIIAVVVLLAGWRAARPCCRCRWRPTWRPAGSRISSSGSVRQRLGRQAGAGSYGKQFIGDLAVKTELLSLLTGNAAGTLGLSREGFSGQANISYGLGNGRLDLKEANVAGNTAMVPGMPAAIAKGDGKFTLKLADVKFTEGACAEAKGEVWTDALTKVNIHGWKGPELRGPVTCAGGNLKVRSGRQGRDGRGCAGGDDDQPASRHGADGDGFERQPGARCRRWPRWDSSRKATSWCCVRPWAESKPQADAPFRLTGRASPHKRCLLRYLRYAGVAQLVRVPACHAGGRGFEPRHSRQVSKESGHDRKSGKSVSISVRQRLIRALPRPIAC